ncbi:MAG: PKD domain-containing protein, partial [Bacteroidia bacterium]
AVSPNTTTTYTLTVTDANGCTATATEIVTVNPTPVAAFSGAPLAGCSPLDISFTDVSSIVAPGTITAWLWEFGDNTTDTLQDPLHTYYNPMSYGVTLTVVTADGCTSTLTINNYITVYPDPVAGFSAFPQPATAIEPIIYFTDQSSGATAWEWNFGDVPNSSSSLQNPVFEYPDSGCYYVQQIVISPNNCRDTTETLVCIQPDWSLYIPNAFTPDKDGLNDIFLPLGVGIDNTGFEMWIFDRWGNLIFYTNDMYHGWDGKAKGGSEFAQVDTYVYKIKCKDVIGAAHKYIGKVSLVR